MIFSASADLLNARGMIIPRALHKSADAEKITIKLLVTDIYISNFSQSRTHAKNHNSIYYIYKTVFARSVLRNYESYRNE